MSRTQLMKIEKSKTTCEEDEDAKKTVEADKPRTMGFTTSLHGGLHPPVIVDSVGLGASASTVFFF